MSENSALSALLRRRAEYLCYRFAQPPKCELVHTLPFQAIFFRSRHQPRRPPLAKIKPGSPVPTLGMGTATRPPGIVLVEPAKPYPLELVSRDSKCTFQVPTRLGSGHCGLQGLPAREKAVGRWQNSAPRDSQNGIMEYGRSSRSV